MLRDDCDSDRWFIKAVWRKTRRLCLPLPFRCHMHTVGRRPFFLIGQAIPWQTPVPSVQCRHSRGLEWQRRSSSEPAAVAADRPPPPPPFEQKPALWSRAKFRHSHLWLTRLKNHPRLEKFIACSCLRLAWSCRITPDHARVPSRPLSLHQRVTAGRKMEIGAFHTFCNLDSGF